MSTVETRATAAAPPAPFPGDRRWMVVAAGGVRHRIDLASVREVATARSCTRLPGAPPAVLGLANLRGSVVTVVALAGVLGGPGRAPAAVDDGRFVVVALGARRLGLAVDEVVGLLREGGEDVEGEALPALDLEALLGPLFG